MKLHPDVRSALEDKAEEHRSEIYRITFQVQSLHRRLDEEETNLKRKTESLRAIMVHLDGDENKDKAKVA